MKTNTPNNMKELILLLLLFTGLVNAQIVNIPDANFKIRLLEADALNGVAKNLEGNYCKIDANNDGEIEVNEALNISYLFLYGYFGAPKISQITGLEKFINITYFHCGNNLIANLDFTSNTMLTFLNCGNNQLTSLNIDSNTALNDLYCGNNQLSSLNLSANSA